MAHERKAPNKAVRTFTERNSEIKEMIDDLESEVHRMSNWESDFYENISNDFEFGKDLSENVYNSLKQIHEKLI